MHSRCLTRGSLPLPFAIFDAPNTQAALYSYSRGSHYSHPLLWSCACLGGLTRDPHQLKPMRILRLFQKKGAHMLQCLCGQRSEPTTTTSGETFSCACSPLSNEKHSHWPLALVSTSSVSAVYALPLQRICANLLVRAHATSCDHSCHCISRLMTRSTSPSWSWAWPPLQSQQFIAEIRVKDISYWYREQRKQVECRKLLMHMQQMRSAKVWQTYTSRAQLRWDELSKTGTGKRAGVFSRTGQFCTLFRTVDSNSIPHRSKLCYNWHSPLPE